MGIRVDLKKARIVLFLITLLSSLYLAGYVNTFGSEFGHSFSLFVIFACIVQRGFPFRCFIFLLVVFSGLTTAFYQMYLKAPDEKDPMGRNFAISDSDSYGQAHFEQPKEYENEATIESPETALGMIYGQYDGTGRKLITQRLDEKHRGNRNVAVIGASGSGKTYTFVGPALLQIARRRESVIITDPDGGLYKEFARYFHKCGYKAARISLNDMHKSEGWDCLKSVKSVEDATIFAEAVISNVLNASDQNSIYGSGAKILLKALILRVILDQNLKEEEKTIQTVYRSLLDKNTDKDMEEYINELAEQGDIAFPCLDAYKTFQLNGEKMRDNIRGNLAVYLQVLADPLVSTILSTDDIDLELPGREPCAYFCGFPDSHSTYKFITSLFFSMSFIRLYNYADVIKHGKLDIPVNFMLDEFPSIGGLPDWDKKMATLRKRNVNVTMIFQDIAQFQNIYEKSWGTILNNCKTMIILGINEDRSAALMSKRIGDTTIKVKTEQKAKIESVSSWWLAGKENVGEGKRPLVSYSDLFTMPEDNAIILFQGHNPVYCRKYPIPLHPDSKKLEDIDFDSIPDIYDVIGRERIKETDEAYRAQYLKEHPLSEIDRTYKDLYKKGTRRRKKRKKSAFQPERRKDEVASKTELCQLDEKDDPDVGLIQLEITETFTIGSEPASEKDKDQDEESQSQDEEKLSEDTEQEILKIETSDDEEDDWDSDERREPLKKNKKEEEKTTEKVAASEQSKEDEKQVGEKALLQEQKKPSQAVSRKRARMEKESQMKGNNIQIPRNSAENTKGTLPTLPGKRKHH